MKRTIGFTFVICFGWVLLSLVPVQAQARVDIEVFPETSLGPVSPYVFGAGIDHKTNPMRFGIEPLMQINFVGESDASIRGYIEYLVGEGDIDGDGIDWAAKRAANGREAPYRIRYWQLGNEVPDHQGVHPGPGTGSHVEGQDHGRRVWGADAGVLGVQAAQRAAG